MLSKTVALAIAGGVLLTTAGGLGAAQALTKDVTLDIDGQTRTVRTYDPTVGALLKTQGISLGAHDIVAPGADAKLSKGSEVSVRYGRQLHVTVDGDTRHHWTTARTVDDALSQLAIRHDGAQLSVSRSMRIGREGLSFSVELPKKVTVELKDGKKDVSAVGTVKAALAAAGVTADADDKVEPGVDTKLSDGLAIKFTTVEVKETTKDVNVAFKNVNKDDDSLAQGVTKVATKGVDGTAVEKYSQRWENGVMVEEKLLGTEPRTPATDQVTLVGTKVAPVEPVSPAKKDSTGSTGGSAPAPAPVYSGSHADWMAAAGIAASDFGYVEKLIAKESGWNPNIRNSSSGACGLVQALPCSKLGPNWNDPVVALRWGDSYVKGRYGSWAGAWAHSQSSGWY